MLYYKTYEISPKHEWIVMIHGLGGSSTIWYKQIKDLRKHFNLLLVELRGHGKSPKTEDERYTFAQSSKDVVEVMNYLNIKKAHFLGISLGSIVIRNIAYSFPEKVKSMILGGLIIGFNLRSRLLITAGNLVKKQIPYMWLYHLFAWIMMPRKEHKESRQLFGREAKRMNQMEFIKWFRVTRDVDTNHQEIQNTDLKIPTLCIMGENDYMFLPKVQKEMNQTFTGQLLVIEESGHVCNVEAHEHFNKASLEFIRTNSKAQIAG
ncbi:alpha/beta fold hydrolase [Halalkalibacter okhensis]|uniref:2-succinyl-6-hydroxy-2, 4-cyclohexadiene-1-carboxylate synthase n=1 Tax=Halalkalibacter okhensis TaxID=333138 RepID=A0A0B0IGL0_9BACI|nr:alpha/beta hydrolase [Halalkalibacter okhensis]KHF40012.1 2-succinyl-6-hydroxy-2,4-cyclohexadiene-1-carboxylate synthase [Halalkalibacter okhensis]